MGLTYAELSDLGRLRKQSACGPYSTFCRLMHTWRASATPAEIAHKVGDLNKVIQFSGKLYQFTFISSIPRSNIFTGAMLSTVTR